VACKAILSEQRCGGVAHSTPINSLPRHRCDPSKKNAKGAYSDRECRVEGHAVRHASSNMRNFCGRHRCNCSEPRNWPIPDRMGSPKAQNGNREAHAGAFDGDARSQNTIRHPSEGTGCSDATEDDDVCNLLGATRQSTSCFGQSASSISSSGRTVDIRSTVRIFAENKRAGIKAKRALPMKFSMVRISLLRPLAVRDSVRNGRPPPARLDADVLGDTARGIG